MRKTLFLAMLMLAFGSLAYNQITIHPTTPDTIYIGATRAFVSVEDYFTKTKHVEDVYLLLDSGTYYTEGTWIGGKHITLDGQGKANIRCVDMHENVMWIFGNYIHVKGIHMKHFDPGTIEINNCSGRVIAFEGARHCIVENCDLNGCGLSGLHDNVGNEDILIKDNWIHNNSVAAYTDMDGNAWMSEMDNHPVFRFENNAMDNNGPERLTEPNGIEDYIVKCPSNKQQDVENFLSGVIALWKDVPHTIIAKYTDTYFSDQLHIIFEDRKGRKYDFGLGTNCQKMFEMYYDVYGTFPLEEFVNKEYIIDWEWKQSSYNCCEGSSPKEWITTYYPSIIDLVMIVEEE